MVDFVMAEVKASKSFERAVQESIEKVVEVLNVITVLNVIKS